MLLNHESAVRGTRRSSGHGFAWVLIVLLACAFALGDAAVVAWLTHVASDGELAAYGSAFTLISIGVLLTAWEFMASSPRINGQTSSRPGCSGFEAPNRGPDNDANRNRDS